MTVAQQEARLPEAVTSAKIDIRQQFFIFSHEDLEKVPDTTLYLWNTINMAGEVCPAGSETARGSNVCENRHTVNLAFVL